MLALHIPRHSDGYLAELLGVLPAIMIDGPKGVGKTETARLLAKTVLPLDTSAIRETLAADYGRLLKDQPPVLIDEWQRLPEVWDYVRRLVDGGLAPGTIILTGSVQRKGLSVHTGAGRIVHLRMRPLSLAERNPNPPVVTLARCLAQTVAEKPEGQSPYVFVDYMREITRSGFPAIYRAPERSQKLLLDSYLDHITSREFSQQGISLRQPTALFRWLQSYAAATATSASYNKILDGASGGDANKPAKETTIGYREALSSLWLLDELPFWGEGEDFFGRLKQTPKHYLADPALEARLLRLTANDLMQGIFQNAYSAQYGSIAGRLFESLCALSLRSYATVNEADIGYLRTANGTHEIDFVIQKDQALVAIEVKMAPSVSDADVRHLNWFAQKVGSRVKEKVILTTGSDVYRRPQDRVLVVPALLFGA